MSSEVEVTEFKLMYE